MKLVLVKTQEHRATGHCLNTVVTSGYKLSTSVKTESIVDFTFQSFLVDVFLKKNVGI